jgi:phosphoribosylaminoimidazole-succinocarboxamide synthase
LVNCNPDPNVAVGHLCDPFKEMVIRGYYLVMQQENMQVVKRTICGVVMY